MRFHPVSGSLLPSSFSARMVEEVAVLLVGCSCTIRVSTEPLKIFNHGVCCCSRPVLIDWPALLCDFCDTLPLPPVS